MPGVTKCESQTVLAKASPSKKSRLSLRFFQKKETKRALDFTENPPAEIQNEENEPEISDQVVPAAQLSPPVCCVKKENLIPFVGFNNLGNTCYLNSILQVLCYCPGFKRGVTHLSDIVTKKKEMLREDKERTLEEESAKEPPASYEVICSLSSLIRTVEHLQLSFLSNPDNYESELAAQPRRLLNTLRELNPMYEGYLQHDAQEVLQCILGNIQEACQALKNETSKTQPGTESSKQPVDTAKPQPGSSGSHITETGNGIPDGSNGGTDGSSETTENGKRKSDNEVGNAKKKTKLTKEQTPEEHRLTRSKRKSASEKPDPQMDAKTASANSDPSQKKSKLRLNWLRSSKQPSILSKFCNLGKHATSSTKTETGVKSPKPESEKCECNDSRENGHDEKERASVSETETKPSSPNESTEFELVEKLFQGQLVLRTRCLECESFTERREDFQDISVPVQENEPDKVQDSSNISPEPRMETKSLKWAISQFASVERIVGEDKYFCENCHHYTEAERSLLFDKIPEIVTIHLKCFAANSSEFDTYGGLSKVTTPLLTPLTLSLEEWSTKPSKDLYGLFAVVMHSGVTISSGHYTAYVKITDLRELDVDQVKAPSGPQGEIKTEPLTEDEARAADETYDAEVFSRVGGSTPGVCKVTKKSTDAVGLLGGQKTKSDFEHLTNKTTRAEKLSPPLIGDKPSDVNALNSELQPESEGSDAKTQVAAFRSNKTAVSLLQSLKEYKGQWLLFDDSEVKVTEERDFLDTISPTTTSTSTPYLLFYKKIAEQ